MLVPASVVSLLKPWNEFYSHSKGAETVVQSLHIGGILLAGGLAIAADRSTIRTRRTPLAARAEYLAELATVHRWVVTGLTIVILSGLALLASDIETFFSSWIFWTKMGLVVLLLLNGWGMMRVEDKLRRDPADSSPNWGALHRVSIVSLTLWFVITVLGIALVNFS